MTEKSDRTCATCACAQVVKHPTLLNQSQLFCRRNPPFIMQQQVRTDAGMTMQQGLSHQPIAADGVCFDGWRPLGTLPGENVP